MIYLLSLRGGRFLENRLLKHTKFAMQQWRPQLLRTLQGYGYVPLDFIKTVPAIFYCLLDQ